MDKKEPSDYSVGYKKPPRDKRFKPGQSGNSKGRPKRSTTFADVLTKQLGKQITVSMGNEVQKMPMLEAIAIKHVSKAISGDPKSTAIVLAAIKPNENDRGDYLPDLLQQFRSIHASRKDDQGARTRSTDADKTKEHQS